MCPVSPYEPLCRPCDDGEEGYEKVGDGPYLAQTGKERSIGQDDLLDAEGDEVVQPAIGLPSPKTPSAKEVALHNLTHLP